MKSEQSTNTHFLMHTHTPTLICVSLCHSPCLSYTHTDTHTQTHTQTHTYPRNTQEPETHKSLSSHTFPLWNLGARDRFVASISFPLACLCVCEGVKCACVAVRHQFSHMHFHVRVWPLYSRVYKRDDLTQCMSD